MTTGCAVTKTFRHGAFLIKVNRIEKLNFSEIIEYRNNFKMQCKNIIFRIERIPFNLSLKEIKV